MSRHEEENLEYSVLLPKASKGTITFLIRAFSYGRQFMTQVQAKK